MSSCYSGYEDRSFEFDDSSFDSGYEKSFETDGQPTARRLLFDAAAEFYPAAAKENPSIDANIDPTLPSFSGLLDSSSNHSCRSARTLVEHVISKAPPTNPLDKDLDSDGFTPTQTSTPSKNSTELKPKRKYAVGKNRVTRSRSPMQVIRIKKFRRMKANDRERNRMHMLNDALERLRITLPSLPEETKLTKIEVLRFAYNYIYALEQVLESGGSVNLDLEKLQNFTLSGERITKELFDALFVNPQPYPTILGMGMVSYAMAARLPYSSASTTTYQQHNYQQNLQHQQQQHSTHSQHNNSPAPQQQQRNFNDYYGSSSYETQNPHFSNEKFELFKQTFETAANMRHPDSTSVSTGTTCTAYDYPAENAGYAHLTPADLYHTEDHRSATHLDKHTDKTATALHQQSSFFTQTPPWKDYNDHYHES